MKLAGYLKIVVLSSYTISLGLCLMGVPKDKMDHCTETLDGLVVTWAPPGSNNPWAFSHLPTTTKGAEAQKWVKLDDGCTDDSLQHKGQRYVLGSDLSVLIIYDPNGYVAGLQRTIPKALADSGGVLDFQKLSFADAETINGQDRYVFTNYFIDPTTVCTGRSKAAFTADGTKSQVYIKNGPNTFLQPPNIYDRATLDKQKWTKGLCVDAMGNHEYLGASKYMSCADQQPYFLTYDCGRLVSVGFFAIGNFTQEPRYEYVPRETLKIFISPVPECLYNVYGSNTFGISAMHMFFTKNPNNIICPK